jgi:hypothetical protein
LPCDASRPGTAHTIRKPLGDPVVRESYPAIDGAYGQELGQVYGLGAHSRVEVDQVRR